MDKRQQMHLNFIDNFQDKPLRVIAELCVKYSKSNEEVWKQYYEEYLKNRENLMVHQGKSTEITLPCYDELEFEYDVLSRLYVDAVENWYVSEEMLDCAAKMSRDMLTFLLMQEIPRIETSLESLKKVKVDYEGCKRFLEAMIAIAEIRNW